MTRTGSTERLYNQPLIAAKALVPAASAKKRSEPVADHYAAEAGIAPDPHHLELQALAEAIGARLVLRPGKKWSVDPARGWLTYYAEGLAPLSEGAKRGLLGAIVARHVYSRPRDEPGRPGFRALARVTETIRCARVLAARSPHLADELALGLELLAGAKEPLPEGAPLSPQFLAWLLRQAAEGLRGRATAAGPGLDPVLVRALAETTSSLELATSPPPA